MTPELLAQIKAVVESGTVLVLAVLGVGARGPERLAEIKAVVESGIVLVLAVLGVGARGY